MQTGFNVGFFGMTFVFFFPKIWIMNGEAEQWKTGFSFFID